MLEHARHHHTRHAITRVDYHLERPDLAHIDERKSVLDISIKHISLYHPPLVRRFHKVTAYRQVAYIRQARLQANRECLGPAEFHAVVSARVVCRGNHYARRVIELAYREIQLVSRRHAKVNRIDP